MDGTKPLNGRRLLQLELRARYRVINYEIHSPALYAPMAPRRLRRKLQKKNFRPVYGYRGPGAQPPTTYKE